MVDLVARQAFTYARRALRPGDVFAAHEPDVRILVAIGKAAYPDPPFDGSGHPDPVTTSDGGPPIPEEEPPAPSRRRLVPKRRR